MWYVVAAVAAFAVALATTWGQVFDAETQAFFATNGDSLQIAGNALAADWSDVARWWSGPWIQHEMYYRPLSSMLFFLEGRLFSYDFQRYCMVSWVANGVNVALLMLLGASLARGSPRVRLAIGLLTAGAFLLAKHPELYQGPGYPTAPVQRITAGVMPWWPVQTDLFSMMLGLLSLLLLDRHLQHGGRALLVGAAVAFVAALLFKEMALCVPLMVPLLVLYRRRDRVLPISGLYLGLGAVFYLVRAVAAPGASGLELQGLDSVARLAFYATNRLSTQVMTDEWFPVLGSLGLLLLVGIMVWRRIEWIWISLAGLLWLLGSAQLVGGSFALISIGEVMARFGTMLLFWSGLALLLMARDRGVSLALTVAMIAACIPVLNRMGPHYWYWLLAFYALLNASLLNRVYELWRQPDQFALIVRRISRSSE